MSVTIKYNGESGSHLNQYAAARLFADWFNLPLMSDLRDVDVRDRRKNKLRCDTLVTVVPASKIAGHDQSGPELTIGDEDFANSFSWTMVRGARYLFNGNFADSRIFDQHRDEIRKFFILDSLPLQHHQDIAIHYRCGGFAYAFQGGSKIVHPDYYIGILDKLDDWRQAYLFTDEPGHPCVQKLLKRYDAVMTPVRYNSARQDFHLIASFNRAIVGNSTFSFWATFLGRTQKVWTFKPQLGAEHPLHQLAEYHNSVPTDGTFWRPE